MEIKELRYFVQICKYKSFSNAAKSLFITQQALSKSMKNLEVGLSAKLFKRTASGVEITEDGEYLRAKVEDILNAYTAVVNEVNTYFQVEGRLSVGFAPGFLAGLSPYLLQEFNEVYTDVRIEWKELSDLKCEELVRQEQLDVGCGPYPRDLTQLDFSPIKSQQLYLFVDVKHPLANRKTVNVKDLEGQNLILFGDEYEIYHKVIRECKEAGFDANIVFVTWEVTMMMSIVERGKGVSIFSFPTFKSFVGEQIRAIPFEEENMNLDIGLVLKKEGMKTAQTREFVDFVIKKYGEKV